MLDFKLSVFKDLQTAGSVLLSFEQEVVRLIRYDESVANKTDMYRQMAYAISRDKANDEVKRKLMPAFSVAVTFDGLGKQTKNVVGFTGLALCDIDHVDKSKMEDLKLKICQDPHTLMVYQTISGEGFRIIYRYERETPTDHLDGVPWLAAYIKGNTYFSQLVGCEYDGACSDYVRLSGVAHDPDVYYHLEAEPFIITDGEIVAANLSVTSNKGKPRKEHPQGSFQQSAEVAWPKVEQTLLSKHLEYKPHHHHDYVMHAAFLFCRFGVPVEELQEWAEVQWSDYAEKDRRGTIASCYKKSAEQFGTWKLAKRGKGRENAMITLPEIRQWLNEHVEVCFNEVTDQAVWRNKMETGGSVTDEVPLSSDEWMPVDENFIHTMRGRMAEETGKRVLPADVNSVLKSDFARIVNPVREYICQLPKWDGVDRVEQLAGYVLAKAANPKQTDEEAQADLLWALHKWLVGTVATWMSDEVVNHQIFTIIGEQGIYKTTFFRHLLPPALRRYFWENAHNSFHSKDDKIALSENCLVEIEEMDAIEGRDMAELKSLCTSQYIKERRPYALFRSMKPRLASFCASGNEQKILTDSTGTRRWLCFLVSQIRDPREWELDYEQFYAQLRDQFQTGFRYWFDDKEKERVKMINRPFRLMSVEEDLIDQSMRKPRRGETFKRMNPGQIAMYLGGGHFSSAISPRKVGNIMRKLKWPFTHRADHDYYHVVEIPYDQRQNYLAEENLVEPVVAQRADSEQLDLPF